MERGAFEERDANMKDLARAKLYFPVEAERPLPVLGPLGNVQFTYGTLQAYEQFAVMLGRLFLKESCLSPLEGCCAAASESCDAETTLVVFPGAGTYLGIVDTSLCVTSWEKGTYLGHVVRARQLGWNVAVLCPLLLKYNDRDAAYRRHVSHVWPLVQARFPRTKKFRVMAFSLGGVYALKSLKNLLQVTEDVRVCLIDSVCTDLRNKRKIALYRKHCFHITCAESPREEDNGLDFVHGGTEDHRLIVHTSLQAAFKYLQ